MSRTKGECVFESRIDQQHWQSREDCDKDVYVNLLMGIVNKISLVGDLWIVGRRPIGTIKHADDFILLAKKK